MNTAIENAESHSSNSKEHGSFENWLALNHPKTKEVGKTLQKKFRFTGGEIVNEFLMSTGCCLVHTAATVLF